MRAICPLIINALELARLAICEKMAPSPNPMHIPYIRSHPPAFPVRGHRRRIALQALKGGLNNVYFFMGMLDN